MQLLQSAPALLTDIFMAAQAAFGHVRTVITHDPRACFRFEHQPVWVGIALIMHAALNADAPPVFNDCHRDIVWHEIVARTQTIAVDAVAYVAFDAVMFVLQASHLFIAEGFDEIVKVSVRESKEHGVGQWVKVFDDL